MAVQDKELYYPLENGERAIALFYEDHSIWLSTEDIARLYETPLHLIIRHIKMIYMTDKMSDFLTVKQRRTNIDGRERLISYYNLQMIVAIGNQLKAPQLPAFYKWALTKLNNTM